MATRTLSADTLISTLMPSGGGSLASGDTIQLAGHSLIIDADAVDYPVTIANSGADANLELRDLGRIKLNATLPATVHPWVDPEHPLPVSAEQGIDGDPYRTPLTANARAEIQLNGNFGIGGGAASLPTETRDGAFYGVVTGGSGNTIAFDRDIQAHAGDMMQFYTVASNMQRLTVSSYDSSTYSVTFTSAPPRITAGDVWVLVAGGVCIRRLKDSGSTPFLSANMGAGTIVLFSSYSSYAHGISASEFAISAKRCIWTPSTLITNATFAFCSTTSQVDVGQLAAGRLSFSDFNGGAVLSTKSLSQLNIGEWCGYNYSAQDGEFVGDQKIGGGIVIGTATYYVGGKSRWTWRGVTMPNTPGLFDEFCFVSLENCTIGGNTISSDYVLGGTMKHAADGSIYHAPATATDVTWRYTDRTVAPGATLRLRCAWRSDGSVATRASVAVTDQATWWPQLWPLGAEALVSVEFTGGSAVWRSELLTWRNAGTEAAQVRVWECVTGTTAGGYLKVEEVKGGQL